MIRWWKKMRGSGNDVLRYFITVSLSGLQRQHSYWNVISKKWFFPLVEDQNKSHGAGPGSAQWNSRQSSDWVRPVPLQHPVNSKWKDKKYKLIQVRMRHKLVCWSPYFFMLITEVCDCFSVYALCQISENGWWQSVYGQGVTAGVSIKDVKTPKLNQSRV